MKDYYKKLYILDASVIIKWIAEEDFSDIASRIKEDFRNRRIELGIPQFAFHEVLNFIGRKEPIDALFILSGLLMLKITEYRLNLKNGSLALEIMQKCPKVSFYDASYHATAIENNGTFITADEEYYQKAKSFKHIKLLKDYQ